MTPHLVLNDAAAAMDFYRKAFGAEESMRMASPDGRIAHAEMRLGSSVIMLSEEMPRGETS